MHGSHKKIHAVLSLKGMMLKIKLFWYLGGGDEMKSFKKNAVVQWKWLGRVISGEVIEIFFEPVEKLIKEKRIKRNGSRENPAYLVRSAAGNLALKLHSELSGSEESPLRKAKADRPRLFR